MVKYTFKFVQQLSTYISHTYQNLVLKANYNFLNVFLAKNSKASFKAILTEPPGNRWRISQQAPISVTQLIKPIFNSLAFRKSTINHPASMHATRIGSIQHDVDMKYFRCCRTASQRCSSLLLILDTTVHTCG